MRSLSLLLVALLFGLAGTSAREADALVHTFSIVARDPTTGDVGVAVQSHWFSVGSIVSWAERAWVPWPHSRSWIPATD